MRSCEEQNENGDKGEGDVSHFFQLSAPALRTNLPSMLSKSIERVERIPCIYMFPFSSYLFLTKRLDWLLLYRHDTTDAVV